MSDNTTNKLDTIIEKVSTQSTNTDAQLTQQHLRITSKLAVAHALYDVPKRMEELVAECDSFLHSGTALTLVE